MKNALIMLLLLPFAAFCQETTEPSSRAGKNIEIGILHGFAWDEGFSPDFHIPEHTISIYRNFKNWQTGVALQFGIDRWHNSFTGRFIAPSLVVNKVMQFNKLSVYCGGRAGYTENRGYKYLTYGGLSTGFATGLQAGIVLSGKHFGLNAEIGARSEQMWTDRYDFSQNNGQQYTYVYRDNYFDLYFPLSLGVRYKF